MITNYSFGTSFEQWTRFFEILNENLTQKSLKPSEISWESIVVMKNTK